MNKIQEYLLIKLEEVKQECVTDSYDWNIESERVAKEFIADIPHYIAIPGVDVDCDGIVMLEWYSDAEGKDMASMFAIEFGANNYIFSLLEHGVPDIRGYLNHTVKSKAILLQLITLHFIDYKPKMNFSGLVDDVFDTHHETLKGLAER